LKDLSYVSDEYYIYNYNKNNYRLKVEDGSAYNQFKDSHNPSIEGSNIIVIIYSLANFEYLIERLDRYIEKIKKKKNSKEKILKIFLFSRNKTRCRIRT